MAHWKSRLQTAGMSDSPLSAVLSYLILLGGLITVVVTGYVVVISYSRLPFAESWLQIWVAAKGISPVSPHWLWQQHLEHRFPIPKLFLAVDLWLFHASQQFLLASIFTIQLLHLALLGWSIRALGGWRGARWRTGFGLAAFCLFFPSQWETFVFSFEVNFVLSALFASLSFIALLLYWIKSRPQPEFREPWKFLLLSMLAALGATFSLANGSLVWVLLLAAALVLRLRRSAVATLLSGGAISILGYFHGYVRPPESDSPLLSVQHPHRVLDHLATYLGASWTTAYGHSAMFFGFAGLALAIYVVSRFRLPVEVSQVFSIQLLLILMFCLATAIITALGRSSSGIAQAFSSRYQTFALLFWWALLMLLLLLLFRNNHSQLPIVMAQACLLALMLGGIRLAGDSVRQARLHGFDLNVAAAALLTNTPDRAPTEAHLSGPEFCTSSSALYAGKTIVHLCRQCRSGTRRAIGHFISCGCSGRRRMYWRCSICRRGWRRPFANSENHRLGVGSPAPADSLPDHSHTRRSDCWSGSGGRLASQPPRGSSFLENQFRWIYRIREERAAFGSPNYLRRTRQETSRSVLYRGLAGGCTVIRKSAIVRPDCETQR